MSLVVLLIALLLTFFFPIISIPLNVLGMIISHGRIRKCYGFLFAFSLAIMAYLWIPNEGMDLYRFHRQVKMLGGFDFSQLGILMGEKIEPLHYLIEFFVAQTGKINLLQFFVIWIGYSGLFWLICDYSENHGVKHGRFVLLLLYAFTAVKYIDFVSGLWFNLAMICTAIGIYLNFSKKTKLLQYLFYCIAVCLHIGTLYFMIIMVLLMKIRLFKRIRLSSIILIIVVALSFGALINVVGGIFGADSPIAKMAGVMYDAYFVDGGLYGGLDLYVRIATMIFGLILATLAHKIEALRDYSGFVFYFSIYAIVTAVGAEIFVRYAFLIAILSLPLINMLIDATNDKAKRLLLLVCVLLLICLRLPTAGNQLGSSGLNTQIKNNLTNNTVKILEK